MSYGKKMAPVSLFINSAKAPVGGYCKNDEQCQGSEHSGVCKHDRCVCKTGHVLTNLECHEGKLRLLLKI